MKGRMINPPEGGGPVTCQVRVVRGLDEVVRKRLAHVLILGQAVLHDDGRLRPHQEIQQALWRDQACRVKTKPQP